MLPIFCPDCVDSISVLTIVCKKKYVFFKCVQDIFKNCKIPEKLLGCIIFLVSADESICCVQS